MMRIRDDHSGSSAASQLAAGAAAAGQPGARRPASPAALPVDAAPEALRRLGRAPRPADDATPGSSGSSRQVRLRTAPADLLTGLPQAVHETIAAGMGPKDRAMLACSNRALRDSLRGFSISDKAAVEGRDVLHLHQFMAVLHDVRSRLLERQDLQARPLTVLAWQIRALDANRRRLAFRILATILQAPAGDRRAMDGPLMMLAAQVTALNRAEQAGAFQKLLQAQEPPGSQAEGLHLLAGRLEDLPQAARQHASTQVLEWAERLEAGPAQVLSEHLRELPAAAQAPAFSGLLQACSSTAPGQRSERLVDLARGICGLARPVDPQAVRGVLAAAEPLAPAQRWAVLKPLGLAIGRLPADEHASTWQAVVHSYLAVPPEQLAAALAHLHDQVRTLHRGGLWRLTVPLMPAVRQALQAWSQQRGELPAEARSTASLMSPQELYDQPPAERQGLFEQALQSIPLLQEEHCGHLLKDLAKAVAALPEAARQPQWQHTLQAVEQLPPRERVPLFDPVAAQIDQLPMEARQAAFEGLLQAHRRLPAEHDQVPSLTALGTACVALPRAAWPGILDRVLAESGLVKGSERQLLGGLNLIGKFCLAEPAAHAPIAPQPDVRLSCLDKVMAWMSPLPHPSPAGAEFVKALKEEVMQRLWNRPDKAFLVEVLQRLLRLGEHWAPPGADGRHD
jgi:hypothetical protein